MDIHTLIQIEKGFWFEGAGYYHEHASDHAVFVFPGMRLNKNEGVRALERAPRWDAVEMTEENILKIADDVVVLTYHAKGKREGQELYVANITTVYRIEVGAPKMIFHQHTPDPEHT